MINKSKYLNILNKPKDKKLRLFCFPYAGGSASIYTPFKDTIGEEIELVTVQLPGRAERMFEDPIEDMDILVDTLFEQMKDTLNEPYAFFGHSMGGAITYALTKKIEQKAANKPEFIIISASKPPHIYNQSKKHLLDDEALTDILREHKASPKEVLDSKEMMQLILPSVRADYQLLETYKTQKSPTLLTQAIIFNDLNDINKETISSWQEYFNTEIEYVNFEGGHFFIHSQMDKLITEIKNLVF